MSTSSIVVGIDGSEPARQAAIWAAREAARRNATLTIAHVYPKSSQVGFPTPLPRDYEDTMKARATSWLEDAATAARRTAPATPLTTTLLTGGIARELVSLAKAADMMVLGTRGLGGFTGLLAGSTAITVTTHSPGPVVVVRSAGPDIPSPTSGPIVVGVDGGSGDAPIEWAFTAASLRHTELVVVHTWTEGALSSGWDTVPYVIDWQTLNDTVRTMLAERMAPCHERFPNVQLRLVTQLDSAAHALIQQSKHAQLVVVGSRGHSAFAGALLGSTSHALLHHAACPVAVVRTDT